MTTEQKHELVELLRIQKVEMERSLSAISKMSKVGNESTISDILNKKWEERNHIHERVWMKLANWLGYKTWVSVDNTTAGVMIHSLCTVAKRTPQSFAIISEPGCGKTEMLRRYAKTKKNVAYVEAAVYWNRKTFLQAILRAMGLEKEGGIPDLMEEIVEALESRTNPLIIIDEADKLKDGVIDLFNALYNAVHNHAGFVMAGAPFLAKRIDKGVRMNKQSYKEIFSRVGGAYEFLGAPTPKDIKKICIANGVTDEEAIQEIIGQCNGDLRKAKNKIQLEKYKQNEAA